MFAQVGINEMGSWANFTAVGALIVVVMYLITRGLPAMIEKFTETSKEERREFGEILTEQRNDFKETLNSYRQSQEETTRRCHSAIDKLSSNVESLSGKLGHGCPMQRGEDG